MKSKRKPLKNWDEWARAFEAFDGTPVVVLNKPDHLASLKVIKPKKEKA